MLEFDRILQENVSLVNREISELLDLGDESENRLLEAMRYASLNGGKRIRPFLVAASSGMFNVEQSSVYKVSAAIEMVHCYSLVHDDLPSMDNDDLRRGMPTCHIAFDEATAILAGDALLTKAFEILSDPSTHLDAEIRADLCFSLAQAAGSLGMVGGQMFDLIAEGSDLLINDISKLQKMKTGKLIVASCIAGAILGKSSVEERNILNSYGEKLGLVFQITDDLLDVEGTLEVVGKTVQKDKASGKATFVSLLGIDKARQKAEILSEEAISELFPFGERANQLKQLVRFIIQRKY